MPSWLTPALALFFAGLLIVFLGLVGAKGTIREVNVDLGPTPSRVLAVLFGGLVAWFAYAVLGAFAIASPIPTLTPSPSAPPPTPPPLSTQATAPPVAAPTRPPTQPVAPTVATSATPTAGVALHGTTLADLRGHRGPIRSLSFNANGSRLLSGSDDGKAIVWDIAGARSTLETSRGGPVDAVGWSPGSAFGDVVSSAAWDPQASEHTVELWSATSGDPTLPANMRLVGHTNRIRSLAWAPDGKVMASGADDATVRIWAPGDIAPLVATLNSDHGAANTVTWIGTEDKPTRLAAGTQDGTIIIWDLPWASDQFKLASTPPVAQSLVGWAPQRTLTTSPMVGLLAFISNKDRFSIVDATIRGARPREIAPPRGNGALTALAWSEDGALLATGSDTGVVRIWDARGTTASPLLEITDSKAEVTALAWSGSAPEARLAIGRQDYSLQVDQIGQ